MVDVYVLELWNKVRFNFFFYLGVILALLVLAWRGLLLFWVLALVLVLAVSLRFVFVGNYVFLDWLKSFLFLALVLALFKLLGYWFGGVGVLALFLGFVGWRVYKGRRVRLGSVRKIEGLLFGKPLDEFKKGDKPSIYKKIKAKKVKNDGY